MVHSKPSPTTAARLTATVATLLVCLLAGCGEESAQNLMMRGMQKSAAGDHAGALELLDLAIDRQTADPTLLVMRGGLHDALGDPAAALTDYEAAIALSPALEPGLAAQMAYLREQLGDADTVQPSTAAGPTVTNVTFCSEEPRGYRDFSRQPAATYDAGDTVWIYLDVANVASRTRDDGALENDFEQSLRLTGPRGRILIDEVLQEGVRVVDPGTTPDRFFLSNRVDVPDEAPDGTYRVDLTVKDRLAGASAVANARFAIIR